MLIKIGGGHVMSRLKGIKSMQNDILESITPDADNLVNISLLTSFCQNRGISVLDLDKEILESFNIDISRVAEMTAILENVNGVTDELSKMRSFNETNPLITLYNMHRKGMDEKAARIQRIYLDFCEAINNVLEKNPDIMEANQKHIDTIYEIFKLASEKKIK